MSDANFDRVARPYRWLEYLTFGHALERCRNHFLAQLADRKAALVLGDGDGRFLAGLLAANMLVGVDAVDTSPAMLHLLTRRAERIAPAAHLRLRTHLGNAIDHIPSRRYDLLVTHFFLDCLSQADVERLCKQTVPHLTRDALWLVSDFRIPTGAMRWPAKLLVRSLYGAFRVLTGLRVTELPDHATALAAAGFTLIAQHDSLAGLLTTQLWRRAAYTPEMLQPQLPNSRAVADPLPDPEPASPSLPDPAPGVFQHEPASDKPIDPDE